MKKNKAIQEYLEGRHLKYFAETEAGKLFLNSIRCCSVEKSESPDFLLIDNFGKKHGLEITNLCKNHPLCSSSDVCLRTGECKISSTMSICKCGIEG